jgi:integrative and conjugative element protein (TIGR02256 family)
MFAILKKYKKVQNIKIIVPKDVKLVFDKYKQMEEDGVEACGILIGQHSVDEKIIIDTATAPSKSDKREKHYFKIDSKPHQRILDGKFIESQKESVYLGTWHSHPEPIPAPSKCDIKDWKKQYRLNKHLFDNMIFAIVGITTIKYWIINKSRLSEIKEDLISYE